MPDKPDEDDVCIKQMQINDLKQQGYLMQRIIERC